VFFVAYGVGLPFLPRASRVAPARDAAGAGGEVFRFGRWIVASHLLFALYSRVDLLMIGRILKPEDAAFYSVAWNFSFPIDLCTYSVILALLPRVARLRTRAEYLGEVRRIFALCAGIAVLLLPLFFLAGPSIRLLFPGYAPAAEIFQVLFLGPLVTVLVHPLYLILYARNRVALLTAVDLLLVLACAGLCLLWIPQHGTLGAAWATVVARLVNCVLVLFLVVLELRSVAREPAAAFAAGGTGER
jgi:O-antigen/teichoic acid export membrane protein